LDYNSDLKVFGKKIGKDFFEGKITLPIILLFQNTNSLEKEKLKLNVFRCLRKHIIISFKNNKLYLCLFFRQTPIVRSYITINQKADKVIRRLIHRFCGPFKTCYRSSFSAGLFRINSNYV